MKEEERRRMLEAFKIERMVNRDVYRTGFCLEFPALQLRQIQEERDLPKIIVEQIAKVLSTHFKAQGLNYDVIFSLEEGQEK